MRFIKYILIVNMIMISFSCSNKQEKLSKEPYVSDIQVPELEDERLQEFAQNYDTFINKAIEKSLASDGDFDKAYQAEFEKDFEVYQNKMKIVLGTVSARDATFFQKYVVKKQQELAEIAKNHQVE